MRVRKQYNILGVVRELDMELDSVVDSDCSRVGSGKGFCDMEGRMNSWI